MMGFTLYGDAQNYHTMSHQLVDKGIFGYGFNGKPSNHPNAFITPGYPLFLGAVYAVFHDKYLQITVVRLLQALISGFTPLLAFLFLLRIFKRRDVALLTAFFMAVYPTYIQSPFLLLTEVWSLASMLLYFYLAVLGFQERKAWLHVLAGGIFAVHILFRPAMLPLFIIPYILLFFTGYKKERRELFRVFAQALSGFTVIMLPWWIRNLVTFHKLILMGTGSGNPLLAGTYPYMADLFKDCSREVMGSAELQAQYGKERLLRGFLTQPLLYFQWYTVGKIRFMFAEPWLYKMDWGYQPFHRFFHTLFVWGGLLGVVINSIHDKVSRFVNLYGFFFLGLYLIFIPVNRYAYQLMFFLMTALALLACDGVKLAWNTFRTKRIA
jgi:4-amino-4-deoxy-L-arabinose transferase-like glycosyltransferase